mmetsp:Transcript_24504/g.68155  ORF Transcript_24504/g.68155 Transcript_24504/m.68155 type:complete len:610 (+) Transcript_24504:160-1989(+)
MISPEHSASARLTCKWWCENHDSVVTRLVPPRLALGPAIDLFPGIRSLDTRNAAGRPWPSVDSHDALVGVRKSLTQLTQLSGLTDLSLGGAGSVTYMGSSMGVDCAVLAELAAGLPNLKRLSVSMCHLVRPCGLKVLSPLTGLVELDMQGCDQLRDAGLQVISQALPGLHSLLIGGCTKITDVGIQRLTAITGLRTLDTSDCILVRGAAHSAIATLTGINLSGCEAFPSLMRLVPLGPQLTNLDLSWCKHMLDNSLPSALPVMTNLTSLSLRGCTTLSVVGLPVPGSLRNLTDLDISGCYRLKNSSMQLISVSMPRLRRLSMAGCPWVSDPAMAWLKTLPLEYLNLQGTCKITDNGVVELMRGNTAATLRELYLDLPGIQDPTASMISGTARRLTTLHLRHVQSLTSAGLQLTFRMMSSSVVNLMLDPCTSLGDECIETIVQAMPNLENLHLACAPLVKDVSPISRLGMLQCLTFKGILNVSQEAWEELGPLPRLRSLYIEDCQRFDSTNSMHKRFPRLQSLSLRFCRAISDPALTNLIFCHSLRHLDLSGTNVSDIGVAILSQMDLQSVELRDCPWVSPQLRPPVAQKPSNSSELAQVLRWLIAARME